MPDQGKDPEPKLSPRTEVPDAEAALVFHAIVRAVAYACNGKLVAGFDLLVAGLRHAEQRARHEPSWGPLLVGSYRRALNNYCRRFLPPWGGGKNE